MGLLDQLSLGPDVGRRFSEGVNPQLAVARQQRELVEQQQRQQQQQQQSAQRSISRQFGAGGQFAGIDPQIGDLISNPVTKAFGMEALKQAQSARQGTGGAIGSPSPKDFTTESLAKFQQSNDPRDLTRFTDPEAVRRQNLSEDRFFLQQQLAARPSDAQLEKIIQDQTRLDTFSQLSSVAEASYFGFGVKPLGEAAQLFSKRFGGERQQDFNAFWQQYGLQQLEIRKAMFGTQFTPTEERIFDRLTISPADSFATAQRNLQTQRSMVREALRRRRSVLEDVGIITPSYVPLPAPGATGDELPVAEFP